jgi:predicted Zn-dependent protease
MTKEHFKKLSDSLFEILKPNESVVLNLTAEQSCYIRWTKSLIRQNTDLDQYILSLQFQSEGKTVLRSCTLSGQPTDLQKALNLLIAARSEAIILEQDPHQVAIVNNGSSHKVHTGHWPSQAELIEVISSTAKGSDLAGLSCFGKVISANSNSAGQEHWFESDSFFVDYSLYNGANAAKAVYAGRSWSNEAWQKNLTHCRAQLNLLDRPQKSIQPGQYRTYLAPGAVSEILSVMAYGGLSSAAWKQGRSPFKKLADGEKKLSTKFHLRENFNLGLAPQFNSLGEVAPDQLSLIEKGVFKEFLTTSRSAKEYGLKSNASDGEYPRSPEILAGTLEESQILKQLGTGLYLSNLHYLNWSDITSARITGMSRYACFWVEGGEIVGPIKDLRFDESLYSIFGDHLIDLTSFVEMDPQVMTYSARSLGGKCTPGALIDKFTFTL